MRLLGFVVLIVSVVVAVILTGGQLLNLESAVLVLGITPAALLLSFGSGLGSAFKAIFTRNPAPDTMKLGIAVFERGKSFAVAGGVLGTLIGWVLMLKALDDPAAIGPSVAVVFMALFYGLLLAYGLFLPLVVSLRRRLAEAEK